MGTEFSVYMYVMVIYTDWSSVVSRGVFWLPGNPPTMIFLNQESGNVYLSQNTQIKLYKNIVNMYRIQGGFLVIQKHC